MTLSQLVVAGLATWRLSNMLVNENGPFGIFTRVRKAAGIKAGPDGLAAEWHPSNVLACVWCTSVWIAPLTLLLPRWFIHALAISSTAIIVSEWGQRGSS